jgi:hypothetical protein
MHRNKNLYSTTSSARSRGRHLNAKRLGGPAVHDRLDFGCLFDWDVAGYCTLKDLIHENRSAAKHVGKAESAGR